MSRNENGKLIIIFVPNYNLTVKTVWEPNNYTVTINSNGGDEIFIIFDNQYEGLLTLLIRTGYTFSE